MAALPGHKKCDRGQVKERAQGIPTKFLLERREAPIAPEAGRPMGPKREGKETPNKPPPKTQQAGSSGAPRKQPNQSCAHATILERHPIKQKDKKRILHASSSNNPTRTGAGKTR